MEKLAGALGGGSDAAATTVATTFCVCERWKKFQRLDLGGRVAVVGVATASRDGLRELEWLETGEGVGWRRWPEVLMGGMGVTARPAAPARRCATVSRADEAGLSSRLNGAKELPLRALLLLSVLSVRSISAGPGDPEDSSEDLFWL